MDIFITEATNDEIVFVHQVMQEAFKEYEGQLHPPSGALRETTNSISSKIEGRGGAIIAWDGTKAVGSALYYWEDQDVYIGRVSVVPSHRGNGIGKKLIHFIENIAVSKGLLESKVEVRLSIPSNIALYQNMNYEVKEQKFYPDRTDSWYVMKKRLLTIL